jgi:kumamolisin
VAGRKVFEDSVVPLPEDEGPRQRGMLVRAATAADQKDTMEVLFALGLDEKAKAELEDKVAAGEVVPPEELAAVTVPEASRRKLTDWLGRNGFEVDHVSDDGSSVYATSTVSNIAQKLQVEVAKVTRDGVTYNAARTAPSLPEDVAEGVQAIIGLQPFRHANKHTRRFVEWADRDPEKVEAAVAAAGKPPYLVADILAAYGASNLSVTGVGQTIAILIDTVPAKHDLTLFWKRNGMRANPSRVTFINVGGGVLPPAEGEETLDVEWSSGVAPGAKIRVYAAGSLRFVDLDKALDRIIADLSSHPGMRQLSISLGLGEKFLGGPAGEVATQHQKFLKLAAAGVNVFVSSGDAGSNPDASGHSSNGPRQAEYEASDTAVIGVGGTSLRLSPKRKVTEESGWIGSGGGASIFFSRPTWQTGAHLRKGKARLVPDVSLAADPNTGALVVLQGQDQQIGGTSWSAPVWAGFCALINEARTKAGLPAMGFLNPSLYSLAGTPCFRDITAGTNGGFDASVGYDKVTGLGTPNVGRLIKALTKEPAPA